MKEVFNFIRWQFKKWKWSDYVWFLACGMVGAGAAEQTIIFYIGLSVAMAMAFGFLIKIQWESYKRDRNKLFDTIKDSQ